MSTDVLTNPAQMRQQNATSVLKAVRTFGPMSRSDVAKRTGLSKPTVNEIVSSLLFQGYLDEAHAPATERQRPGPKASQLTFVSNVGFVLGIDLSLYKIAVTLADLNGVARGSILVPVEPGQRRTARTFVGAVDRAVGRVLQQVGVARDDIWRVCLGVPGAFDPESGSIRLAPTLAQWRDVPLGTMLRELFSCPVLIENEVHLSVLAEQRWGGAKDVRDAVYFHAGIGLALGLLIDGKIYRGADGIAGEIGYMLGATSEAPDHSDFGAFEWSAGGLAFTRLAQKAIAEGRGLHLLRRAGGQADAIDAKLVFAAAREGDTAAAEIVDTIVERLAIGIANICCILNPAVVILGAGLAQAGADLLHPLQARVAALSPMPPRHFTVSELGPQAVILGAVEHALRAVEAARFNLFADLSEQPSKTREAAVA